MNLIPFIIIIIMVLGLFSLSQFHGAITQKKEHQLYLAYFEGLRKSRNNKEETAYKKAHVKQKPKESSEKEKKPYQIKYFRVKREGWEKGRLNLSSLLKKPHKYEGLESLAENYVKQLYGHASFFPKEKNFPKVLIENLVKIYTDNENPPAFHEIHFEDSALQEIFFKMVHGTHTYDLAKKIGYPPFGEMFSFEKSNRPPMNFHYANLSFLSMFLGEDVKQELVTLEQELLITETRKCCSPLEIEEAKNFFRNRLFDKAHSVISLFDYKYETSKREPEQFVDPQTAITVKVH